MSSIGEDFTESIGIERRYEHLSFNLLIKKAITPVVAFLFVGFQA